MPTDPAIALRHKGRRVVLVDDDADVRGSMTETLRSLGFGVAACESGEAVLKLLERVPTPDALIVDLRMPEMSGWELIDAVRADSRHARVPIVILSGLVTAEIAQKLGAVGYVRKPFQVSELAIAVQKACVPA